ncbi:MAG: MFS transporter [Prolixibacteraceae bacterium]|nr:MFS transporter [Prolixibacteraceae bacterium]
MTIQKLNLKEKIGYGFGDAASSMFWKLFSMYLMFFYTDIFGISAVVVGTMFLVTRIWDAAFDPFVGILADRTETKWGKFRPYLLWVMVPFGIMGVITFSTPDFGMTGKIIYAYITYSLMMMVYSLINVPYASLMGVMSSDGKERTSLATFRFIFAFGGSLLVLALAKPLSDIFSNMGGGVPNLQFGWQMATVVFAIIATIFFWFTFSWTRERVKPITEKTSLKHDLKDLWVNRPWFILLGAGIASIFFNSIRDGAAMYYFTYYIPKQEAFQMTLFGSKIDSISSFYFVLGQAANIVGVVLAIPVSNWLGKKNTFLSAMLLATVFSFYFYFIDKNNTTLIFVMQFLISICAGITFPLIWSMYADAADYSEWKTKRRATGLVFSASSMSQKFGWTIGGALVGWLLGFYGFQANVAQTETAQNGIRMMLSFYPAIGTLLGVGFMLIYPLSEKKMEQISGDLAALRGKKE